MKLKRAPQHTRFGVYRGVPEKLSSRYRFLFRRPGHIPDLALGLEGEVYLLQ